MIKFREYLKYAEEYKKTTFLTIICQINKESNYIQGTKDKLSQNQFQLFNH